MVDSEDVSHADLEWTIGLNRFGLKSIGLWPEVVEKGNETKVSNFRVFFIFTSVMAVLIVPEVISLAKVSGDMMLIIDNLQTNLPIMSTMLKVLILWWKKEAVSPLVKMVTDDWLKEKSPEERRLMVKQARLVRFLVIGGYCTMIGSVAILTIPPPFGYTMRYATNATDPGKFALPVQSHYFYDIREKWNFRLTFAGQAVLIAVTALCYTSIDNLLGLLVLHACGQMDNLRCNIENLPKAKDASVRLALSVEEHVRLIRFISVVENTFNLMLLGQLCYFAILFCFQGFLLIHVMKQDGELPLTRVLWQVAAFLTVLVHMFLQCFVGESIVARCEAIHAAAYECDWYYLEPREARKLIVLMGRAKTPLHISAGKIFPMTMSTFFSLVKTSGGYISVLMANM